MSDVRAERRGGRRGGREGGEGGETNLLQHTEVGKCMLVATAVNHDRSDASAGGRHSLTRSLTHLLPLSLFSTMGKS